MNSNEPDESLIPDEPMPSPPGGTLDRVYAALRGEFDADQLSPDEERLFMDMFAQYLAQPNAENDAFMAKMRREGGYVGEDEQGRLVRTLRGGGIEVIAEADYDDPTKPVRDDGGDTTPVDAF
ncbi:hypothetical protein [Rhodanobacter soli]